MIFTCGVRFMRLRSAGLNGRASGSARAAARTCRGVIGRKDLDCLPEVVVLLMFCRLPCRDKADAVATFCMDYEENRAFNHADQNETLLTIVFTVIQPFDAKGIFKDLGRDLEADAVPGLVVRRLLIIPFKPIRPHSTEYPYNTKPSKRKPQRPAALRPCYIRIRCACGSNGGSVMMVARRRSPMISTSKEPLPVSAASSRGT